LVPYLINDKYILLLIGAGSNPYWNESFVYSVNSDDVCELELKLMDADSLTQNDFLGGAK
jgi:Ca2+-dependent lipid-binding protein